MIAGDVRTLARNYCENGTTVHYEQYDDLTHVSSLLLWLPNSIAWIMERFAGLPAPDNCSSTAPGNPLDPIPAPHGNVEARRALVPALLRRVPAMSRSSRSRSTRATPR
jgi:hypothetical protein